MQFVLFSINDKILLLLPSNIFSSCGFKSMISTHSSFFTENSAVLKVNAKLSASGYSLGSSCFNSSAYNFMASMKEVILYCFSFFSSNSFCFLNFSTSSRFPFMEYGLQIFKSFVIFGFSTNTSFFF